MRRPIILVAAPFKLSAYSAALYRFLPVHFSVVMHTASRKSKALNDKAYAVG